MSGATTDTKTSLGSVQDFIGRLRATLPTGWFPVSPPEPEPTATPVLDGLLAGVATSWAYCFQLLSMTSLQTRVATAVGAFLDMASIDFFAQGLPRRAVESDESFRRRIQANLLARRGTRQDIVDAAERLGSLISFVCEPGRIADCGTYGARSQGTIVGGAAYCSVGLRYGSASMAFQYLINIATSVSFAPGMTTPRESPATFIDSVGLIKVAGPRVLRPNYQGGVCVGPLLEPRAFNLIKDSRRVSEFNQSMPMANGTANWSLSHAIRGLFEDDPVIQVTTAAGNRVAGPSVDVAVGGSTVTGSIWLFLTSNVGLGPVELVLQDLNVSQAAVYVGADMTKVQQWQRVSASLQVAAAPGKNLRVGLVVSGAGTLDLMTLTQCWQVEVGDGATSYIPTCGTLGMRQSDQAVSTGGTLVTSVFTDMDMLEAMAMTVPAATVAWVSVTGDCSLD